MNTLENISDVFSILHDGSISAWTGTKKLLRLKVDCLYLAERIDKSYDHFYIELSEVSELSFSTWPNPIDLPVLILTDPDDIFKADLEVLSAEIEEDKVVVVCEQHDTSFDYCGGTLNLCCKAVKVFDQGRKELTIDEFDELCSGYWDEWSKK